MLGGALYLIASLWTGPLSIALILLGRFLGGAGAANSTLGFTYVARVVPKEHMTKANSLLSMVRIIGMMVGPAVNGLLGGVNVDLGPPKLDPLNSVGLILVFGNLFGYVVLYCMLEEPPEVATPKREGNDNADTERSWVFWKAVLQFDIIIPLLVVFGMNANFQLLETGLAPAASDAMGWTPATISAVFGGNAVLIFIVILITFKLSAMGVKDIRMIQFGLLSSIIGYGFMYNCWRRDVSVYEFVSPSKMP
jgi:MFS family permease